MKFFIKSQYVQNVLKIMQPKTLCYKIIIIQDLYCTLAIAKGYLYSLLITWLTKHNLALSHGQKCIYKNQFQKFLTRFFNWNEGGNKYRRTILSKICCIYKGEIRITPKNQIRVQICQRKLPHWKWLY